jgi:hypothetical protein
MPDAAVASSAQRIFDAAVVITTVLRPTLTRAVRSIFARDPRGRIQVLIGIDIREGSDECLDVPRRECPGHVCLTVIDLGYSTSVLNGGIYPTKCGGAPRTILSYAANSKYIAYLDDDDWWATDHLSGPRSAIEGNAFAFSWRWLVDPETGWTICRDEWDSLGPGKGISKDALGGFICPSSLMLDKEPCHLALPWWSLGHLPNGGGGDVMLLDPIKELPWAASENHSCFYELRLTDQRHAHHAREFAARGIDWVRDRTLIDTIRRSRAEAVDHLARRDTANAIAACRAALALNPLHEPSMRCLAFVEGRTRGA